MAAIETIIPNKQLTPWGKAIEVRAAEIDSSYDLSLTPEGTMRITTGIIAAGLIATAPVTVPPLAERVASWYSNAVNFLHPELKQHQPEKLVPESATPDIIPTEIPITPDNSDSDQGTGGPILTEPAKMAEPAKPVDVVVQPPAVIIVPTVIPAPKTLSIRELPAQPAYSEVLTESDWNILYLTVQFYAKEQSINPDFLWEVIKCENKDGRRTAGLDIVERYGTNNGTTQIGMGQIIPSTSYFAATGMRIPEQRQTFSPEKLEEIYKQEAYRLANPDYAARQAAIIIRILNPYQQFPTCSRVALSKVGVIYAQ